MNEFDQTQAEQEGWCISECIGSSYFPEGWSDIQTWDEYSPDGMKAICLRDGVWARPFENDWKAFAYVTQKAADGSVYHQDAIRYMERKNFALISRSK